MIDLLDDSIMKHPYDTYNRLRESARICQIYPGDTWFVGRYADVCQGLNDYELFTSTRKTELFSPAWFTDECKSDLYLTPFEPPKYRHKRAAISPPFTLRSVCALAPLMEQTAKDLTEKTNALTQYDFIRDFAYPYVGAIVNNITGLTGLQTSEQTQQWIQAVEQATLPDLSHTEKDKIQSLIIQQKTLFKKAIEQRRQCSTGDFASELVASYRDSDGDTDSDNELINALELLVRAGFQTTVHLLSIAVIQLKHQPDILEQLTASPSVIPCFVEELLRLYSSVPFVVRHTTRTERIYGTVLPEGSPIYFCLAAANRDPRQFENPDAVNLSGATKKGHIAFGYGPHICLGLHLARLELQVALKHIVPILNSLSCPSDNNINWIKTLLFRGLESLPITRP